MHHVVGIEQVGALHVISWLHDETDPSRAQWQASYDQIAAYQTLLAPVSASELVMLIVSDGGAPNSLERSYMAKHFPFSSAVVTTALTNPIKRGIATAISWTNPRFFFTEPKQWPRALDHLHLGAHGDQLWNGFRALQKQMPLNKTLEHIARAGQLPSLASVALPAADTAARSG